MSDYQKALDLIDELLTFVKDREEYFITAKESLDDIDSSEYDYYEGAEEAYGVLWHKVSGMRGELVNG